MCDRKPTCGSQGITSDDDLTAIFGVLGAIGTIIGIITTVGETAGKGSLVTILGISAPGGVWLAAVAGALITYTAIVVLYNQRCTSPDDKLQACSSGIIQHIEPSFNSASEEFFPFTAMHDRVDVVIICDYWFLVEGGGTQFVKCAPDTESSPILSGFYFSEEVCGAGVGSLVGGAAGVVGGIIAGAIIGAAIGCATIILCLIAIIVAAIVAAAAVIIGAFIGGQIGKAVGGDSSPTASDGSELSISDVVTTEGGLITNSEQGGARTYWWVDRTVLHGRSPASAPFSHLDAEAILKDSVTGVLLDACPRVVGPIE